MRFFPIVWRNLLRRKFRTIFTIGAVFFAFLLFGVLMAIRSAFGMGVEMAGQSRLMMMDKVSIINPLPASYETQVRQVPGVTDITHANWFGGYYQDVRNQFATFATDPESWLRVYSKEYELPEDQKKAFIADRTGAVIGIDTAQKYGFKLGQRIPINGTIYRRPDGGPWEFTVDGIYDSHIKGADKTQLLFNYQYLRETIPERSGFRDRYNWYVFTINDPDRAPEIAAKIDAMFANSPNETKTNTEKAFVSDWAKQVGDIGKIMMWIVAMAMFTILLVAGNTMAQAIRERTNELAVLKTLGFGNGRILRMVLLESALIAVAGGGLGLAVSYIFITVVGDPTHGLLPAFYFPTPAVIVGVALVGALGLASGFLPAWQASRLRIVDALRRN
ncbi:MAG TPA: FtsX-like permease family protein [Vicinamibacterales bacterium]|jgi:putative ABC transport system permease protein|nr:FtsX-like permease family protein [Vicinamibacterales bacterium]